LYNPNPDGLCGDEDNGQTSAWYVFSALGFYPVCPGSSQYVLGSPLFNGVKLHLENGKTFVINGKDNSKDNIYIASAYLNGKNYTKNFISHEDIMKGGILDFQMSTDPNLKRGINELEDFPFSFSNEFSNVANK
ncbi:MAG: glycoside hydrolase family 92 protein, partial [Bacteroidota bacterium]|nr:glycoside hydrolase family 92 protein [Bacteroidota bacterium]